MSRGRRRRLQRQRRKDREGVWEIGELCAAIERAARVMDALAGEVLTVLPATMASLKSALEHMAAFGPEEL